MNSRDSPPNIGKHLAEVLACLTPCRGSYSEKHLSEGHSLMNTLQRVTVCRSCVCVRSPREIEMKSRDADEREPVQAAPHELIRWPGYATAARSFSHRYARRLVSASHAWGSCGEEAHIREYRFFRVCAPRLRSTYGGLV